MAGKLGNKNHKFDLLTDTCITCGLKKRNKVCYTKDLRRSKKIVEYFVNNQWEFNRPNCQFI